MATPARSDVIIRDFRHAAELLLDIDHPAATRLADTVTRWLSGYEFEVAAGLSPGWRGYAAGRERDAALVGLIRLHPQLGDRALARLIAKGLDVWGYGADERRPDSERGLIWDLFQAGCTRSPERLRKLIASLR